jgi:hypothetical protein
MTTSQVVVASAGDNPNSYLITWRTGGAFFQIDWRPLKVVDPARLNLTGVRTIMDTAFLSANPRRKYYGVVPGDLANDLSTTMAVMGIAALATAISDLATALISRLDLT